MIAFYIQNKDEFREKARYVWRTLAKIMGLDWREVNAVNEAGGNAAALVIYGKSIPDAAPAGIPVVLIAQRDDRSGALTAADVRGIESMQHHHPREIVSLFQSSLPPLPKPLYCDSETKSVMISRSSARAHIAVDLLATCFYFLSLENERQSPQRDKFNRFQRNFSPLGEAIYEHPVVDRYAALLKSLLQEMAGEAVCRPVWPNSTSFAVALSHDVDRIRTWTFHKARRALRGGRSKKNILAQSLTLLRSVTFPENWLGNFNFITRIEQKFETSSTFFFVSRHRHKLDPTYKLFSPRLRRGIERVKKRGSAIGLHGTIPSASVGGLLGVEKGSLQDFAGIDVKGVRQHYLCFSEATPSNWLKAGLKYDSTLGFSYHTGYRCGTSFPFYLHDGQSESPMLEIPLVLMDTVMFLESKQHLSAAQAWTVIEQHLQETKANNGLLTINWHNSDLHPHDVYGFSQLYLRILQWTQEQGGWLASTDEVYEWWEK